MGAVSMSAPSDDQAREDFDYFSNEYAQALQAFNAIEQQAATLLLMGSRGELRQFLEQFLIMAGHTLEEAQAREQHHFTEWFRELIRKAEDLLAQVASGEPPATSR
jgi:hypothetical protein